MAEAVGTSRPRAVRALVAIAAAAAAWPVVLGAGFVLLRASWPEYVAAEPEKAYSLAMLACRLLIYWTAIAATAAVAGAVARSMRLAWVAGVVILAFSIPPHLYPGTVWDDYPTWYHLLYLASVLPCAWLGGTAVRARGLFDPVSSSGH